MRRLILILMSNLCYLAVILIFLVVTALYLMITIGYYSLPGGYCSLVITTRYRSLLLVPTFSMNVKHQLGLLLLFKMKEYPSASAKKEKDSSLSRGLCVLPWDLEILFKTVSLTTKSWDLAGIKEYTMKMIKW